METIHNILSFFSKGSSVKKELNNEDVKKELNNECVKKELNNAFVKQGLSFATKSDNGAMKYSQTNNAFITQFSRLGEFKEVRTYNNISNDCETLWEIDQLLSVKFIFYLRTITRKVKISVLKESDNVDYFIDNSNLLSKETIMTEESQTGGELRNESIMRMIWLANKSPETFYEHLSLFVMLGSWKDIFVMLRHDYITNGWENRKLNWCRISMLIFAGLKHTNTTDLVKKYLPQLRCNNKNKSEEAKANTAIAKYLCNLLFKPLINNTTKKQQDNYKIYNYTQYRKLKSTGKAHEWQQLISNGQFNDIVFDHISGRALYAMVHTKFLKNNKLCEKYSTWIKSKTTPVKYTGFVHELFEGLHLSSSNEMVDTINKQFKTLIEKGKDNKLTTNFIVVRDTSGSMSIKCPNTKSTYGDVAKALALYFSEFLTGKFASAWIDFNRKAEMKTWNGITPVDKWNNNSESEYCHNTNFQSVIDLFVEIKSTGVEEKEFPEGIICVSDGEFDPACLGQTNVEAARQKLLNGGFTQEYTNKFTIVLWNLQAKVVKFETFDTNVQNVFYFSGYNASVIKFLCDGTEIPPPKTTIELFTRAMNQELLNTISVIVID